MKMEDIVGILLHFCMVGRTLIGDLKCVMYFD